MIDPEKIKAFQSKIFKWWNKQFPTITGKSITRNKRKFPWRETTNPYHILVSEFMLQQTQAPRVVEKYKNFIEKFPDLQTLAEAETSEVIRMWSGLGYNRRAIWLQEAAKQILKKTYFPDEITELRALKGIGFYSSRSILIFAFNKDIATVDTNIRRILIAEGFADEKASESELLEIATQLVPKNNSRDWHNALMDYGSIELTSNKTGIKPISKQGKFKGSNRQYRGKIIRLLSIKKAGLSKDQIEKDCKIPTEKMTKILDSLIKDGLIQQKEDTYLLPK
jgi:A/G-specific adenine glycosylase